MPTNIIRYKKKTYKKRPFTKRKAPIMRLKDTVNMGLGFPKKAIVKQKFNWNGVLTSGSGSFGEAAFNLNSVFDPEVALGGHKPYYTNTYFSIYNHYVVLGAKIHVKAYPYDGNLVPINFCLWQNDDNVRVPTAFTTLVEQGKAQTRLIDHTRPGSSTLKWSAKKTFGGNVMSNSNLRGSQSSNPLELSTAFITMVGADGITGYNCAVQVQIEYIVCYFELKDIAGS